VVRVARARDNLTALAGQATVGCAWRLAPLSEVAELTMGQSPPSSTYNTSKLGIPFLQGKAEFGPWHPLATKWCSQPAKVAPPDSVLVSVRAPVGDVNRADQEYCIGRGLAAIVPGPDLDAGFLYFTMLTKQQHLASLGTGSTFASINGNVLRTLEIAVPPLDEQRRIARILSTFQRAKDASARSRDALGEIRRSAVNKLFAPAGDWPIRRIGDLARTRSGGTPRREIKEYYGGKIPWVKSGEVRDCVITTTEEQLTGAGLKNSNAKLFPAGTLLLAMYGATAGQVGILGVEATTNQAVCALTPQAGVSTEFLYFALQEARDRLRSVRFGGAQPNLSQQTIRNFEIAVPDKRTQGRIAHALETIDRDLSATVVELEGKSALFDSAISYLVASAP